MFKLIMGVLEQGLKLWNNHESTKYLDKLIKLKKEWYETYDAPIETRNHDKLADIESELRILAESFIQAAGAPNAVD